MGRSQRVLLAFMLFLAAFRPEVARAQARSEAFGDWVIHNWQADEGLPDDTVPAITQGKDGLLWLATLKGLAGFGGTTFEPHLAPRMVGRDLDVAVNAFAASDGRIWSSTPHGLLAWMDNAWEQFGSNQVIETFQVRHFAESSSGLIALGGFAGEIALLQSNRVERLAAPAGISPNGMFCEFGPDDVLWIFNRAFVGFRRGDAWVAVTTPEPLTEPIVVGPAGGVNRVVLHGNRVWLWNGRSLSVERTLDRSIENVRAVLRDSRGNIWVASITTGLHCFAPMGRYIHFDLGSGLYNRGGRCLFEDNEGNIWLGTSSGGLHRFRPRTFHTVGVADGLPDPVVKAVVEASPGRLLVGTHGGGLAALESGGSVLRSARETISYPPYVWTVLLPSDKQPLLGTYRDGLFRVASGGAQPLPWSTNFGTAIYALVEERTGRIWAGVENGLVLIQDGKPALYQPPAGTSLKGVRCLAKDSVSGAIWGGTYEEGGLFRIDSSGFTRFTSADGLVSDRISAIYADFDGTIWIGTREGGVSRLKAGKFRSLGVAQGLPSATISSILDDGRGALWIGTSKGVMRATKSALNKACDTDTRIAGAVVFGRDDGMANVSCADGYQNTAVKDSSGRVWFATSGGLAWTDPAKLEGDTNAPRLSLESIAFRNASSGTSQPTEVPLRGRQADDVGRIRIPAGSRQFSIRYSAIALRALDRVRFRTRLSGANGSGNWSGMGGRRVAEFFELAPGNYRFEVQAENQFGVADRAGVHVDFTVLPQLWQRPGFWVAVGLALIAGAAGIGSSVQRFRYKTTAERLKQQQALAEARARFEVMVNSTSDLVAFASGDGRLLSLNRSGRSLLGIPMERDLGTMTLESLHAPQGWATTGINGLREAASEGVWSGESTLLRADGGAVAVSEVVVVSRAGGPQGAVEFIALVARDLSDRIAAESARSELEEKLRQSQKMEALGTMAGGIAHDFNNILAAIIPAAELAKADAGKNDELVENLDHILSAAERAAGLVRQILTFSRKRATDLEPLHLGPVVREVLRLVRANLSPNVEIKLESVEGLPPVFGDATQIHQVLMNLCTNGLHAMRGRVGHLVIRLEPFLVDQDLAAALDPLKPGNHVRISITDNGHGMDEATLQRIFDPFFTTKGPGEGTGLGLSVVHGVVRDHGGAIRVYSRPGQGTTFNVYLPSADAAPASASRTSETVAVPGGGQQILLIDDEQLLCTVLRQALIRQGFRVTAFANPVEALEWFEANAAEIDLVISDLTMPHLTGLELGAKVHSLRQDVPVLIVSGYAGRVSPEDLRKAGVSEVLQKPVSSDRLTRAVLGALRRF